MRIQFLLVALLYAAACHCADEITLDTSQSPPVILDIDFGFMMKRHCANDMIIMPRWRDELEAMKPKITETYDKFKSEDKKLGTWFDAKITELFEKLSKEEDYKQIGFGMIYLRMGGRNHVIDSCPKLKSFEDKTPEIGLKRDQLLSNIEIAKNNVGNHNLVNTCGTHKNLQEYKDAVTKDYQNFLEEFKVENDYVEAVKKDCNVEELFDSNIRPKMKQFKQHTRK